MVWFLGVGGYAAYAFATGARRARGITRTRMTAVAAGAILFIAAIVTVLVGALLTIDGLGIIGQVLALAAVVWGIIQEFDAPRLMLGVFLQLSDA